MRTRLILASLLAVILLSSCAPPQDAGPQDSFTAPTRAANPTPTQVPAEEPPAGEEPVTPTTAVSCTNILRYLDDLTIPDGLVVSPGEVLDKQWLVRNDGTCNWDAAYSLRVLTGPDLGAISPQALYPARAGTEFALRMLFTAPSQSGTFRSAWQAYDPAGEPFGDPVYIEIIVP